MQLTTAVLAICAFTIWTIYSIAHPSCEISITQTKLYEIFISTAIALTDKNPFYETISTQIKNGLGSLLPISEINDAYDLLTEFMKPSVLNAKIMYLMFVTFHIQTGMGYLGIAFLREEQNRKNTLIKIEDEVKKLKNKADKKKKKNAHNGNSNGNTKGDAKEDVDPSKKFRKSAGPFIFLVALPYMAQIVFYGAVNMYASQCFRDDIHRNIRLNNLFDLDGRRFVATANTSVLSPGSYATNSEKVVNTVYDLFNQNFFSLPKLMLLPQIIAKQPMLLIKITPLILLSDYVKSTIVSAITTEAERLSKEVKEMEALRNRIEQYDLKNSDLIQRSGYGSIEFTEGRWIEFTEQIQELQVTASIMTRSKLYFSWVQRHFVMMALVDCALAKLIAVGKIVASDIFVYARAIEDFIGFILMRSRAESELASMATSIKVLRELKEVWDNSSENRHLLNCSVGNVDSDSISIQDLSYSRGSASVRIDDIQLSTGIYAVTGANGSGKSTLFRLIMACDTNRKSIDMDDSIIIKSSGTVNMSSRSVVEIAQNFYWPLNTAPVDWIYQTNMHEISSKEKEEKVSKLADELRSLTFYPETQPGSDLKDDLTSIKDDWFADLSGGQKSKVELVRKVFLEERCPNVLLIDETFAPLDPDSKSLVMQKLKEFCSESIVFVIYHADVQVTEGSEESEEQTCVESSNFFDANLHVEDGSMGLRSVCSS